LNVGKHTDSYKIIRKCKNQENKSKQWQENKLNFVLGLKNIVLQWQHK
jgi:hypothetical protein